MKYRKKGKNVYFYQQLLDEKSKRWRQKYIKKEETSLARSLAQKYYYMGVKTILEKQQRELRDFLQRYRPEEIDKVYEELSEERKHLVTPFSYSKEVILQKWKEESYEKGSFHMENLRFETEQGELVRSKSEVIIANILYQHREDILYKYERPLEVFVEGRTKTIYPDFTILNVHTGKVVYMEHVGRMEDAYYVNEFVKKMNIYTSNNLLLGRDVILTFETLGNPLDIMTVKRIVQEICEREYEDDYENV